MENKTTAVLVVAAFAVVMVTAAGVYALGGPTGGMYGAQGTTMGAGHGMMQWSGQYQQGTGEQMMHQYMQSRMFQQNYSQTTDAHQMHYYMWNYCNSTGVP